MNLSPRECVYIGISCILMYLLFVDVYERLDRWHKRNEGGRLTEEDN